MHLFTFSFSILQILNEHHPARRIVQELFEASDVDDSSGIDRDEFVIIVKVSCAQILDGS